MKNRNIIAAAACLAGALGAGAAPNQFNGTPVVASFDRGTNFISIVDGGEGERASPTFFDWNGDGLPDLLEGYMGISDGVGYLNVFLNDGTKTSPHFTSGFESEVHVAGG